MSMTFVSVTSTTSAVPRTESGQSQVNRTHWKYFGQQRVLLCECKGTDYLDFFMSLANAKERYRGGIESCNAFFSNFIRLEGSQACLDKRAIVLICSSDLQGPAALLIEGEVSVPEL